MSLNGIDISDWQAGINLDVVPYDFVLSKATEGVSYVSPDCARQVEQVRARKKRFGVYHYINGSGAKAEAKFFIDNITNWIGKGVLALDYEEHGNSIYGRSNAENYLYELGREVMNLTGGIIPMLYGSQKDYDLLDRVTKRLNAGKWIAQYANYNPTGYQATPWNEGAYACAIRQYTSAGRLDGYNGNLDLDKFYGDEAAWDAYATAKAAGSVSDSTPSPSYEILAIDGSCGPATIRRWQQVMGTTVDGFISGQLLPDEVTYRRPNLPTSCVTYGGYGSELIRKVQKTLKNEGRYSGAIDGLLGPRTIKGIQAHYGIAQDASFGPDTVRHLQQALNENRF